MLYRSPTQAYSVSGTTLTFTQVPFPDRIEVRKLGLVSTVRSITDSDSDTKIQVEEGADDDTIRFDLAGTEVLALTSGKSAFANAVQLASMTSTQRDAISSPTNGMMIYNTTTNKFKAMQTVVGLTAKTILKFYLSKNLSKHIKNVIPINTIGPPNPKMT